MKIQVLQYTSAPLDVISFCAGVCYGKRDNSYSRVKHCFDRHHLSVFENAYFTILVEGISRTCSHQLVRHRMASYCQESQRYVEVEGSKWYVMPEAFDRFKDWYDEVMRRAEEAYQGAISRGIKKEDARFLLPEATKTNLTVTMNVRELFHFLNLRNSKKAQWEIRELGELLIDALRGINDQWKQLLEIGGWF